MALDGNTLPTRNNIRGRTWCFTLNNYLEEDIDTITQEFDCAKKYRIQEEVGEDGTPHLQGFVEFNDAKSFLKMKKICAKAHWEKARNKKAAYNYCKKKETAIGRSWQKPKEVISKMKEPREWQKEVLHLLTKEPDDRTINWYWEPKGNTGKTTLAKHLCLTRDDTIYVSGKSADVKYGINIMKQEDKEIGVVIWDVPRSMEDYLNYEAIESVKNGIFFNTKYESGMCIFNSPHVIVLANFEPELDNLSEDRWKVTRIPSRQTASAPTAPCRSGASSPSPSG